MSRFNAKVVRFSPSTADARAFSPQTHTGNDFKQGEVVSAEFKALEGVPGIEVGRSYSEDIEDAQE